MATVVGIVGALPGGFLGKELFEVKALDTFVDLSTWVTAIVGAVVLFLLFGAVRGRGGRTRRAGSGWRGRSRAGSGRRRRW